MTAKSNKQSRRYTALDFPPYSYVPGHNAHPMSDPAGHMYGEEHQQATPLDPAEWNQSEEYRYGVDLFNHGFYWEAHEAWESLWHAAGRKGEIADFLKGLIKLAAAGVKAREGNSRGVDRHAIRAKQLLLGIAKGKFCGLSIDQLVAESEALALSAKQLTQPNPQLHLGIEMTLGSV